MPQPTSGFKQIPFLGVGLGKLAGTHVRVAGLKAELLEEGARGDSLGQLSGKLRLR